MDENENEDDDENEEYEDEEYEGPEHSDAMCAQRPLESETHVPFSSSLPPVSVWMYVCCMRLLLYEEG